MLKNVSGQKIGAQMVSATDGSAFTGSVTVAVTLDAGTQATGSVGSGACVHEGGGYHTYAPAQAETNGDLAAFTFSGTGAVPQTVQVYTRGGLSTQEKADVNTEADTAASDYGALKPTTAGRTLDVSAGGEAGLDWANIGSPTTVQGLSGTTVKTATDVEIDTQDIQSRLPAALTGAGNMKADALALSGDATAADNAESFFDGTGYAGTNNVIPTVTTLTNAPSDSSGVTTLLSRLSALRAGYLDNLSAGAVALASTFSGITSLAQWLGLIAGKQTGNSTARTEVRATGAGSGTFDETTDSQEALRDNVGTNGAALSLAKGSQVTGFNDLSAAQVNTEADTALSDYGALKPTTAGRTLDVSAGGEAGVDWANVGAPTTSQNLSGTTVKAVTDAVTAGTVSDKTGYALSSAGIQAIWDALTSALTTVGSIGKLLVDNINATISSRLPTSSYTAPPSVGAIADQVWEETLADHSGTAGSTAAALNAAGSAGDPWSTALPGAYGSGTAGKIVGDNLNATVGSRASQASVDDIPTNAELATALAGADDAVLAAIAALNNLSQANIRTAIGLASANLDTQLDALPTNAELAIALAAADDAVLAAIAALNNLSQASVRSAVGLASANLDTQLDALPTNAELATALAAADDAVLAAIGALNNLSAAQVKTQVVDALSVDTYPEPSAVPTATATLVDKINWLAALARNRVTQTATEQTIRNATNTGDIASATVSDDGSEFVRGPWA